MAAKNYTEILALVNAGNQMGLSNTIKRDYGIPLDFTSVQPSYDDAVIYAAENTKAYIGQPLSVGGKLYIINDVAAEAKHTVGEKEYDNYLVEVGSATEGDGVTIDLEAGVLTLHGFDSALTGYLPRKSEDGELEWVPISAVVQGDGNKVTTLTSEDGSVTITKKTDTDESLVYDLSVEVYDDSDLQTRVKAIEDDYLKEADKYDDSDLQTRVKAIEDDYLKEADKYDDTALAARVKALEDEERYDDTELANRVTAVEGVAAGNTTAIANEKARAEAAEQALGARIDGIDYVSPSELATELEPYAKTTDVQAKLDLKADQTDLEALEGRVNAFFEGTGVADVIDTLEDLINYINTHDDADINGILASIQALEGKLAGIDSTVVAYVTAAIEALSIGDYAKAADLTALAGRVEALEAKPFDTYATKSELQEVNAQFANYTTTEALNSLLAAKADADKVVSNDTFAQFQTANTEAIGAARTGAVADVAAVGYALASEVEATYATKQSVTDLGNTINATLNDYAKTADVEVELAKKVESATIAHSTDEKAEGVTKNGTALEIVVDAFTKAETRQYVADTIKTMTGGESAADVKLLLENHVAAYEEKVGQIDAKDAAQDTAISAADAKGAQGIADALAAQTTANEALAQANTNKTDIAGHLSRIGVLETAKGDHETRIATAEGQITALLAEDVAINKTLGEISGSIVALQGEDARLVGLIEANGADIAKKANAADVYTKTEINATVEGINTELAKKLEAEALAPYAKTEDIAKQYATITALEAEAKRADEAEKANAKAIADLAAGAVQDNADAIAEINALLNTVSDEDNITSLKELALWVEEHETEVIPVVNKNKEDIAALTLRVAANETAVSTTLPAAITQCLVDAKKYVDDNMVKADGVSIANTNGTFSVKAVSTDLLTQGSEELILCGGNSGV